MSSDGSGLSNFRSKYFTRENRCFNYVATRFIIARDRSADDEAPIVTAQPAHPDPPLQAKPVASMKVNEQIDTPSIEKTIQPIPGR